MSPSIGRKQAALSGAAPQAARRVRHDRRDAVTQARRPGLEAYLAQSGAIIDRMLEMDTVGGGKDFIKHSDWFAFHPATVAIDELHSGDFIVNPLVDPPLSLELFVLERNSEVPPPEAITFVEELQRQTLAALDAIDALLNGIGESDKGHAPR